MSLKNENPYPWEMDLNFGATVTVADYKALPAKLGFRPKRVEVKNGIGEVEVVIVRKWYQNIFRRKKKLYEWLNQEYQNRKIAGIYVTVTVR